MRSQTPKTTKRTTSAFAACERCGWTGDSKRNVLNEVHTHVLRTHLEEAIERYPSENPYDAAMWYAVDIGEIYTVKKWALLHETRAEIAVRRDAHEEMQEDESLEDSEE